MKKLKVSKDKLRQTMISLLNAALDKNCQLSRRERYQFRFICIAESGGRVKRKSDAKRAHPIFETVMKVVKKAIQEGGKRAVQTRDKAPTRTLRVSCGVSLLR